MAKVKVKLDSGRCDAHAEYDTETNVTTILKDTKWEPGVKPSIPNSAAKLRKQIESRSNLCLTKILRQRKMVQLRYPLLPVS